AGHAGARGSGVCRRRARSIGASPPDDRLAVRRVGLPAVPRGRPWVGGVHDGVCDGRARRVRHVARRRRVSVDVSTGRPERLAALARLRETAAELAGTFVAQHQHDVDGYRVEISAGIAEALDDLRADADGMTAGDPLTRALLDQAREYIDWMQWALWDLPYFAVVLRPDRRRFRRGAAACRLGDLSVPVIGDMLDRHYLYRGRRPTLLATFTRSHGHGHESEGLTVLGALLLCFEGLSRLVASAEAGNPAAAASLRQTVAAARRAIVGTILERT